MFEAQRESHKILINDLQRNLARLFNKFQRASHDVTGLFTDISNTGAGTKTPEKTPPQQEQHRTNLPAMPSKGLAKQC